jgi:hypothetical protein
MYLPGILLREGDLLLGTAMPPLRLFRDFHNWRLAVFATALSTKGYQEIPPGIRRVSFFLTCTDLLRRIGLPSVKGPSQISAKIGQNERHFWSA